MTFDEIWEKLVSKQPDLKLPHSEAVFSAGQLKRLLRQVYEQGQKSAGAESQFPFGDLFGGKK